MQQKDRRDLLRAQRELEETQQAFQKAAAKQVVLEREVIDQMMMDEALLEWESARRQKAEEEEQIQHFQDECYETAEQINYLVGGYFPSPLRCIASEKCVEAMTMLHVYQSDPDLSFLKEEEDDAPF